MKRIFCLFFLVCAIVGTSFQINPNNLAQGTLESHFATKGVGGKINSIFNVCVYDNIKTGSGVSKNYRYPHPDDSIEPYLKLLRDSYLVDGKTESDLLINYVNKHGQRYATYPHYEKQMASIMKRIKTTTKIDSLQNVYTSKKSLPTYKNLL